MTILYLYKYHLISLYSSPHHVPIHEFPMEIGAHVIINEAFSLLHLLGLITKYSVLIPSFGYRIAGVH